MTSLAKTQVVKAHAGTRVRADYAAISKAITWFVYLLTIPFFIHAAVLEIFFVPSSSMFPTLRSSDHIVVSKMSYGLWLPGVESQALSWGTPERGAIVVFNRRDDPGTKVDESARAMVKRVVGVGGDTVSVSGTEVVVNGVVLREPYAHWKRGGDHTSKSFIVPPGKLFLLGDNRDESFDSRFWSDPFVEQARVVGPVSVIY